jgi:hypothetical protein
LATPRVPFLMHADIRPILANFADERLWCLIVMAACAVVGIGVSTLFALCRVPRGERGAFLSRVHRDIGVALFASLWSSLLLAGCVFILLVGVALLFQLLERRGVLWVFLPIWLICYTAMASIWIRRVFRDALAPPDDRPWVTDDDGPLQTKPKRR